MLYIQKGQPNNLVLNINNNSRESFTGYSLTFVHVMSQEMKTYVVNTSNTAQFQENIRYCQIALPLNTNDLNYEGEYNLSILGLATNPSNNEKVFQGIAILEGNEEEPFFTQYISPNEDNENYIYIS